MKIICLVKFTPNVNEFQYDYENNVMIRENVKMEINPDDACALGFALQIKKKFSEVEIKVVTMASPSVRGQMEDILRRNVDKATILSDKQFSGSDTLATSLIIGKYLKDLSYDVILTGSHTLDGDTAHVPSQIADYLKLNQMSFIYKIDEMSFMEKAPIIEVDTEMYTEIYRMPFPAILSICRESKYKLPYVRYEDLDLDVSHRLEMIGNETLDVNHKKVGLLGSSTQVVKTYIKKFESKNKVVVKNDEDGIEKVYSFLKEEGYV